MSYIGIDVGGTNLAAGLVDNKGNILYKVSCPVDKGLDDRGLCRRMVELARGTIRLTAPDRLRQLAREDAC